MFAGNFNDPVSYALMLRKRKENKRVSLLTGEWRKIGAKMKEEKMKKSRRRQTKMAEKQTERQNRNRERRQRDRQR